MAIYDNLNRIANAQVLTTGGGSATTAGSALQVGTNTIDLSIARDLGAGGPLMASVFFGGSQLALSQTAAYLQILVVSDLQDPSTFVSATTEVVGAGPLLGNSLGYGATPSLLNNGTTPRPGMRINIPLMPMTAFVDPVTGRLASAADTSPVSGKTVSTGIQTMPHPRRFLSVYYLLVMPGSVTAAQITTSPAFTIDILPMLAADCGPRMYGTSTPTYDSSS
jgi:hypothetical protein